MVKKTSLSVCCQNKKILSQRPISVLLTILPAAVMTHRPTREFIVTKNAVQDLVVRTESLISYIV